MAIGRIQIQCAEASEPYPRFLFQNTTDIRYHFAWNRTEACGSGCSGGDQPCGAKTVAFVGKAFDALGQCLAQAGQVRAQQCSCYRKFDSIVVGAPQTHCLESVGAAKAAAKGIDKFCCSSSSC